MTPPTAAEPSPEVRELLSRRPVFDAHCDTIARALDLGEDLAERTVDGHLDCVRGAEGGLGSFVVVAWVDPKQYLERSFDRAAAMFRAAKELEARRPDRFRIVGTHDELVAARAAGAIAGIHGIEGGHAIEDDIDKLHWFFERGLRVMTLVWNNHLSWVRSCQDGAGAHVPKGLSNFGRRVVGEMNFLGIVVDLSHAGEQSFYDALDSTGLPVIASHSGCRALSNHPRNLTDHQMRALADNRGVLGIVFHTGFLDEGARDEDARVRTTSAYSDLAFDNQTRLFVERQKVMQRDAAPLAAERVVEHIEHAVSVMGIDHVGLGSDYDGIERTPAGLEDASCYGVIAQLMRDRGFSLEDVEKVLGGNMERVFRIVTGVGSRAAVSGVLAEV